MSPRLTKEEREIIRSMKPHESPWPDWKCACDRLLAELEQAEAERDTLKAKLKDVHARMQRLPAERDEEWKKSVEIPDE